MSMIISWLPPTTPATWVGLMTKSGLKLWSDEVKTAAFLCFWAWWAMAHGVAEGRTRLKWLSTPCTYVFIFSCVFTWSRKCQPTPVLLPGKSHGWWSLVDYSPWGREELDMTERLHFHFSLSCTGEGNGNPLQYSCLENPRDGGAWWAAIYGLAQSLHSSSISVFTGFWIQL